MRLRHVMMRARLQRAGSELQPAAIQGQPALAPAPAPVLALVLAPDQSRPGAIMVGRESGASQRKQAKQSQAKLSRAKLSRASRSNAFGRNLALEAQFGLAAGRQIMLRR